MRSSQATAESTRVAYGARVPGPAVLTGGSVCGLSQAAFVSEAKLAARAAPPAERASEMRSMHSAFWGDGRGSGRK